MIAGIRNSTTTCWVDVHHLGLAVRRNIYATIQRKDTSCRLLEAGARTGWHLRLEKLSVAMRTDAQHVSSTARPKIGAATVRQHAICAILPPAGMRKLRLKQLNYDAPCFCTCCFDAQHLERARKVDVTIGCQYAAAFILLPIAANKQWRNLPNPRLALPLLQHHMATSQLFGGGLGTLWSMTMEVKEINQTMGIGGGPGTLQMVGKLLRVGAVGF